MNVAIECRENVQINHLTLLQKTIQRFICIKTIIAALWEKFF